MKKIIVNKLIQYFPKLKEETENYLKEYKEIYLHLIFGDIFNPYLLDLLDDPHSNRLELIKAGELIEIMSKMDIIIQEVVVTTVLERLLSDREKLSLFCEIAGDHTRQFIEDLKLQRF